MKKQQTETRFVPIALLRIDGGTQPRERMNLEHVANLAEAIDLCVDLPPVIVYEDANGILWLADGFHRRDAAVQARKFDIEAEVRQGSQRDAILCSLGANAQHGLPRSNADKRRAVVTALGDPEWAVWSNNRLSKVCGVSDEYVRKLREELKLTSNVGSENPKPSAKEDAKSSLPAQAEVSPTVDRRKFVDKHGNEGEMNVGKIGKKAKPKAEAAKTDKQLYEVPVPKAEAREPYRAPDGHLYASAKEDRWGNMIPVGKSIGYEEPKPIAAEVRPEPEPELESEPISEPERNYFDDEMMERITMRNRLGFLKGECFRLWATTTDEAESKQWKEFAEALEWAIDFIGAHQ